MNTAEQYRKFIADVREKTGIDAMAPDEEGLVSLNVDERYNLNLQLVEASGKVLCFIEVAHLPPDTPKEVYRDLLAGGFFGRDTAGGYFTLEPETETLVFNYFFDLDDAAHDVLRFIGALEQILQICDVWAARIKDYQPQRDEHGTAHVETHNFVAV